MVTQTYYDILEIAPSTSAQEIMAACDAKHNYWRRLVTHNDPKISSQAQQAIQSIETIRATLTDPAKRTGYDAGIGLGGVIGGLADPTLLGSGSSGGAAPGAPRTPPSRRVSTPSISPAAGLWTCDMCQTENPPQTKFCFKCTTQLIRQCPECKQDASLVATGVCGKCGTPYELASRRVELREQIEKLQYELANIERKRQEAENIPHWFGMDYLWGAVWAIGGIGVGIALLHNFPLYSASSDTVLVSLTGVLAFVIGITITYYGIKEPFSHSKQKAVLQDEAAQLTVGTPRLQGQLRALQAELDML